MKIKINKEIIIIIGFVIVGLLIGSGIIISQAMKQNSIEKQLQMKLNAEKQEILSGKLEKEANQKDYDWCVEWAEKSYWDYMELNGTKDDEGVITAKTRFWDTAEKNKQNAIDNCYNQYLK